MRAFQDPESLRLEQDHRREKNWKRWGPYLAERQWGTVREDYSADGNPWDYFPHDHARSRAYRWGEDGLLGICDREARLCFALALWNGRDPILKERLFGLTGPEGNHGEDVKEIYHYLDSSPTHSYMKALYRYPQAAYPYDLLVAENRHRGKREREFELIDTGVFAGNRYFDITAEYAKASPDDILIRITAANLGPEPAELHLLPMLWFRNTWSWGRSGEGYWPRPRLRRGPAGTLRTEHASLEPFRLSWDITSGRNPELLFTENETNMKRLFGVEGASPHVKDAFHDHVIHGRREAVNPNGEGTRCALLHRLLLPAGAEASVNLRLTAETEAGDSPFGPQFGDTFELRRRECDTFHAARTPPGMGHDEQLVVRQAHAGLLWTKQFYHYILKDWLEGDPSQPEPPAGRSEGRNHDWRHLFNRDIISMPDKWEYPWFAAWDLAFHMIPFAQIDPWFAKDQLILFLREWYMHPNGQLPAYEFAFGDVNPPVHAWAAWRVYKMTAARGERDRVFLSRVFQKLLLNFTWWVNRKDPTGRNLFAGGFLGLDNVGVFDRSKPLPTGGVLEQADGTAWMGFYCATMLSMALELSRDNPATEDMASKFFEHFVAITDAMNTLGGTGLWDEEDGFYYDKILVDGRSLPLRIRSMVGLLPLVAVEVLEAETMNRLPGFRKRLDWFLENRKDLAHHISYMQVGNGEGHRLLALPSRQRLLRVLRYVLDENEFLSPFGIRSLSRYHLKHPFIFEADGHKYSVTYRPGESDTGLFGGNSNWRGPIWLPVNYLLVEALERYHHFYGDSFKVECPTGSGKMMNLQQVAREIASRVCSIFLPGADGRRPYQDENDPFAAPPLLFHEYFEGDTGRGLGASHQTGWTALVLRLMQKHRVEPPAGN